MSQQWLSLIGISCDIVGFMLLSWEWSAGFRQEWRERRKADELQGRAFFGSDNNRIALRHLRTDLDMRIRAWRFTLGFVLVVVGFALQGAGNWPGAFPEWGIYEH